jgi:hypothetical protein
MKWLGLVVAIVLTEALLLSQAWAQPSPLTYAQPLSQAGIMAVQQRLKQNGAYAGGPDSSAAWSSSNALMDCRSRGNSIREQLQPSALTRRTFLPPSRQGFPRRRPPRPNRCQGRPSGPSRAAFTSSASIRDASTGSGAQACRVPCNAFNRVEAYKATGQLNPATVTALGLDPNNLAAPVR